MYLILIAACLWGTTGTAAMLAPAGAGPVTVGAARIALGGLLLLAVAGVGDGPRRLLRAGRATAMLLVLGAVCVAVYQISYFAAVTRTGVATATILTIGSGPLFAGLLARFAGQARLTRRWMVSTCCAVVGCAALVGNGQQAGVAPVGLALALLSGFGYAVYATCAGYLIGRGEDDRAVIAGLFGGAGLLLLPALFTSGASWLFTGQGMLLTAYLGVVTTTVGYLLYGRGLRSTSAAAATTLTLAEPAVAAVLGFVILDEELNCAGWAGLALLAGGLVLLVLPTDGRR